jgi:16S rRNA (guanine966-N2)-methyltransferase
MTRVIAGAAGGRRLAVPRGTTTRPTSDRAREGLFGSVVSELGGLDGKRVLDLYAGSGAVGLEALSRGASHVLLVESDPKAAAVIKANILAVDLPGAALSTDRVERLLARPPQPADETGPTENRAETDTDTDNETDTNTNTNTNTNNETPDPRYDLAFADPPYAVTDEAVNRVLTQLATGWLADGALVVIERATRSGALAWPPGYQPGKSRRYGEATFWYGWYDNNDNGAGYAARPRVTVSRSPRSPQSPRSSQPELDAPGGAHEE